MWWNINKFPVYGECHINNKHQLCGVVIDVPCCKAFFLTLSFILSQAMTCISNIRWCCPPFWCFSEWWLILVELLTITVLTFFSQSYTSFLYEHYPNATFQPSIIDCKLNSHHENINNVHSWNTAYLTLQI
jgi:hypothetical protein